MKAKINAFSSFTKKRNLEASSMEPIEENDNDDQQKSNSLKSKSNKSLTEAQFGMIHASLNKTVNCEMYHGNSKDKIDCP